jgi:CheY-like chemotaxis protein
MRDENKGKTSRIGAEKGPGDGRAADGRPFVLIVDDDPDFLWVAKASLEARGFKVKRAIGGLRGVFLGTQDVPDAILCDLRMPGIDGFVVADTFRAEPATQRVAIFACTGRRDLEARAATMFDGVLVKPVDWDKAAQLLLSIIHSP